LYLVLRVFDGSGLELVVTPELIIGGGAATTSLIIAGVGVLKRAFPDLNWDRWGPLVDVILGIVIVASFIPATGDTWQDVRDSLALGLASGLSAAGLYDGVKRVSGTSGSVDCSSSEHK
jgi:hypothetical protein